MTNARNRQASAQLPLMAAHRVHDLHRRNTDPRYPLQEVDDLLLVICETVGIELLAYRRVLGRRLLVLVENPIQRGAAAELVMSCLNRNSCKLRFAVQLDAFGVLARAKDRLGC